MASAQMCVCVCGESVAAGWWVEIAVIMECYLFIKHTVGTLLTAFRNQLKQHRLLTLATLAGGVCVCLHGSLRGKRRHHNPI